MATMDALLRIRADVQGANGVVALSRSLQGVERAATTASVAMRGVQSAVGGLVGLVGGVAIFTKIFGDTATLQTQTRSLEVLLGSASKASQIIKELQAYGSVTPFESTELIETAKRLGAFGVVGSRVVEVTKRLGDIAGATGANLGELATAYGQVVSKGRLQTEELLQFQERGVGIQAELQKMYGLSGQELQKALSAGRVSSEAFEQAIVRLTEKGGKYANGAIAQSDTLNGRLSTLKDTVTSLSQTIGAVLEPAINRILLIATSTVDTINRAMRAAVMGPQNAETIAQVNTGQLPFGPAGVDRLIGEKRRKALQGQAAGPLGLVNNDKFIKLLQQQPEFRPAAAAAAPRPLLPPALLPGTSAAAAGGGRVGSARKASGAKPQDNGEALARTREGLLMDGMMADKRADYVQTQRQINDLILGQNTASEAGNALLALQIEGRRVMLESGLEQVKLQKDTNRKLAESTTNQDQQNKGLRDAVILAELNATVTERQEATRFRLAEVDQRIAAQRKKDASDQLKLEQEKAKALEEQAKIMTELTTRNSVGAGLQQGLQGYVDQVGTLRDAVGQLTTNAIGGLEDSLTSLATTGAGNFKAFAASVLKDVTRMIIRQLVLKSIMQIIGGIGGGGGGAAVGGTRELNLAGIASYSAKGNVFASNGIQPFAMGGIVNRPTLFPFAKGVGLMGEAGPEAIMPLRRGADGKLGVASSGGGSTTINISVDAKGSSVQGDNGQSGALARAIAGAVQTELIKQKRPGGILT